MEDARAAISRLLLLSGYHSCYEREPTQTQHTELDEKLFQGVVKEARQATLRSTWVSARLLRGYMPSDGSAVSPVVLSVFVDTHGAHARVPTTNSIIFTFSQHTYL